MNEREDTTGRTRDLALEIARCPIINAALAGAPEGHACSRVVRWNTATTGPRYTPEPWDGHLDRARILFISSNPSADLEGTPVASGRISAESSEDEIFSSFDDAFDEGRAPGIRGGTRLVGPDGSDRGSVRYWVWARARAKEMLCRTPVPGDDYALTEAVHCGTQHEIGVAEAMVTCAPRYLTRMIEISAAKMVIFVGAKAKDAAKAHLGLELGSGSIGPVDILGKQRIALHVLHPNAFGKKTIAAQAGTEALGRIRTFLNDEPR